MLTQASRFLQKMTASLAHQINALLYGYFVVDPGPTSRVSPGEAASIAACRFEPALSWAAFRDGRDQQSGGGDAKAIVLKDPPI